MSSKKAKGESSTLRARKTNAETSSVHQSGGERAGSTNGRSAGGRDGGVTAKPALAALLDLQVALALVLGGCCSNVWTYEELLHINPQIGSAMTFCQILFITLYRLPSFLQTSSTTYLPTLKPRQVPFSQWAIQVVLFSSGSLLQNWVYAYDVPLSLMIVFRSAGLVISMILGRLLLDKRYSMAQVLCVLTVTAGVVLASLSKPGSPSSSSKGSFTLSSDDSSKYLKGISLLLISSFMTGLLGVLQEKTYKRYGPCWKEGVFYTHVLSLPIFLLLAKDVKQGLQSLALVTPSSTPLLGPYTYLAINLLSQLVCVSGVNKLSSQVSSVSTNLVLTTRKALSLCFSVWWFGNGWNAEMMAGAGMVFLGSFAFGFVREAESSGERERGGKKERGGGKEPVGTGL